ncbi:hypothetical protein GCM10010305_39430 [Streptomyces termitum]|uniref:Secreted protein n=2 Tax=Streptomyces termitum TaxID=67368 RepID=A0A918T4I6_9ACTN|nr:hypothetical protein GCM10010305_39430 [Streptomyces termitum]
MRYTKGDVMNQHAGHEQTPHGAHAGHAGHGDHAAHGGRPGGLSVSEDGYALELDATVLPAGVRTIGFRVIGPDGRPVTDFVPEHEKDLHFIAVRRDTTGFQHVHPVRDAKGDWSVELALEPGDWRFFTDIHPAGHDGTLTLGIDAAVAGTYDPRPLPEPTRTARVDAYTVTLDGDLLPGAPGELTLTVSRDGRPVTDLQPYLAAYGHLVALRAGDLGYLHVHPEGEPGDGVTASGPGISFVAVAPTAGTYRLYLDFRHDDTVRTAEFTVRTATAAPGPDAESPAAPGHGAHGEHGGHGGHHGAHAHH